MNNTLPLHQANLVRWLNKRVPANAVNPVLSGIDRARLLKMIREWSIPLIVKERSDALGYEILVDEGRGSLSEFYVIVADAGENESEADFILDHDLCISANHPVEWI